MVPLTAGPWGPFHRVSSAVSTRALPSSRVTQPWSIPTQIALSPNPRLAMLHGEVGVLRSLIRPLAALASYQK